MSPEKKSIFQNQKNFKTYKNRYFPQELFYLTFRNFGELKNIILKLKNNIESVRAGTMYRIRLELNRN